MKLNTSYLHAYKSSSVDVEELPSYTAKSGRSVLKWQQWPLSCEVLGAAVSCCTAVKQDPL